MGFHYRVARSVDKYRAKLTSLLTIYALRTGKTKARQKENYVGEIDAGNETFSLVISYRSALNQTTRGTGTKKKGWTEQRQGCCRHKEEERQGDAVNRIVRNRHRGSLHRGEDREDNRTEGGG